MSIHLVITPGGHLRAERALDAQPPLADGDAAALATAFAAASAEGLALLASARFGAELPATLTFWRGVARQFSAAKPRWRRRGSPRRVVWRQA